MNKPKLSPRALPQQLALAGFLSVNILSFQNPVYAVDYGSINKYGSSSTLTLNDGDTITADAKLNHWYALWASDNAKVNLATGNTITVDRRDDGTHGAQGAYGLEIYGGASITAIGDLKLKVIGDRSAYGAYVGYSSSIDFGTGGHIEVKTVGDFADNNFSTYGLELSGDGKVTANGIRIEATTGKTVETIWGTAAIYASGKSYVDLGSGSHLESNGGMVLTVRDSAIFKANQLDIVSTGKAAIAVTTHHQSDVDLGSGSSITTSGARAEGMQVTGQAQLRANALTVRTMGEASTAISAEDGGTIDIGADSHLISQGNGIYAVADATPLTKIDFKGTEAKPNSITVTGVHSSDTDPYFAAKAFGDRATVNLDYVDIDFNVTGLGYALYANGDSSINASNIKLNVANELNYGVVSLEGGKNILKNNILIHTTSPAGVAMIAEGKQSLISGTGKMDIIGGIYADLQGTTDLTMSNGSVWIGKGSNLQGAGTLNLNLTGTRWNMTEDSQVNQLTLDKSIVDFVENKTGSLLTVENLSGNEGTFILRTNIVGDGTNSLGDKLVVTGTSSGNHHLQIRNRGSLATTGAEILTVIETADGGASFNLQNRTRKVELGGYLYNLRQNNNDWELYASRSAPPVLPPDDGNTGGGGDDNHHGGGDYNNGGSGDTLITSTANAAGNFLNVGYLLNYATTQTLLQRMGELRSNKEHQNQNWDVWAKGYAGKMDSFGSGKLSGFDLDYSGFQLGADTRLDKDENRFYFGVMGGTAKADTHYQDGNGTVKGYHFGVYGSYVTANDFYIDATLKYLQLKNSFQVRDTQDDLIRGSAKTDGYRLSLEAGKRFYLKGSGYYIEPQAQISFNHQDGASTRAHNGLMVDLDGYHSTLGRISAIVGYALNEGKNPVNVYVKTGYVREMGAQVEYRLNGNTERHDFGGGWWDNGIGITAQIKKQHHLFLDATYSRGSRFNQSQINAGYRYSF